MRHYPVRLSAKAVIIYGGRLLVIQHAIQGSSFFTLPGGGVNHNEDLVSALKRECLEEAGAEIEVRDLVFVRDYIADNHAFAPLDPGFHQVEMMFRCTILNADALRDLTEPDSHQIGCEWVPLENLSDTPLYPRVLCSRIPLLGDLPATDIYLGDVN